MPYTIKDDGSIDKKVAPKDNAKLEEIARTFLAETGRVPTALELAAQYAKVKPDAGGSPQAQAQARLLEDAVA